MKKIKEFKSNALYVMKAFAVISIVLSYSNIADIGNIYLRSFLSIYKPVGVYIFLILAGYFFNYKKYPDLKSLLLDKTKKICIPWLACGLLTYFSNFMLKPVYFNLTEIINWLLGNGTYLYYLTMLMLIYIVIYLLPKNQKVYYTLILLNLISILLTHLNIFPTIVDSQKLAFTYFNPYLNVFNWIGIFSFGLCLKNIDLFEIKINKKILLSLSALLILIITVFKIDANYWNIITPLISTIIVFLIFEISKLISNLKILIDIGKKTFSIYLLHLPIIAFFCRFLSPKFSVFTAIIVVLFMYLILIIMEKVSQKLNIKKIFSLLSGCR